MEGCYNFVKILVQRWVQVLKESSLDFFTCFRQSNVTRHPSITPPFDSVTHTRAIIPEPCKKKRKTHFPQIFGLKSFLIKSFTFVLVQLSKLTKLILFSILKKMIPGFPLGQGLATSRIMSCPFGNITI